MKKVIYINSGHSTSDSGAVAYGKKESELCMMLRGKLAEFLDKQFTVFCVPDRYNLQGSIEWVNERTSSLEDGLAFSIHLNAGGGTGAESFYYGSGDPKSQKIAQTIVDKYCELTGYYNRGAKPDTSARAGRLGWIRDTVPWATLIECCFIDSESDMASFDVNLIAYAMYCGICDVYQVSPIIEEDKEAIKKQIFALIEKLANK